jgi:hypothetical protein
MFKNILDPPSRLNQAKLGVPFGGRQSPTGAECDGFEMLIKESFLRNSANGTSVRLSSTSRVRHSSPCVRLTLCFGARS